MAKQVSPKKTERKPRRRYDMEGLLKLLDEIGPQHDLADAIQSVYDERHQVSPPTPTGRSKRRHSTPKH